MPFLPTFYAKHASRRGIFLLFRRCFLQLFLQLSGSHLFVTAFLRLALVLPFLQLSFAAAAFFPPFFAAVFFDASFGSAVLVTAFCSAFGVPAFFEVSLAALCCF